MRHVSLRLITFGSRWALSTYDVHKSGRTTVSVIMMMMMMIIMMLMMIIIIIIIM